MKKCMFQAPGIVGALLLFILNLLSVSSRAQCGTTISTFPYSEGFESGPAWTTGGTNNDWAWGAPSHPTISSAGGGTNCWCTGGLTGSFYNYSELSWIQSPCFDFTNLNYPWISFKIFWEDEHKYDGLVLQSSIDGGVTWQNVGAYGDPVDCLNDNWYNYGNITWITSASPKNGWCGRIGATVGSCQGGSGSGGWVTAKHCMSSLANQPSVIFRFLFGAGTTCNSYDGIAVDDIYINDAAPNVANFSYACVNATTVNFTNLSSLCPTAYSWDFGDPGSGASNTSALTNPSHTFSSPGAHIVTLTSSGPCNAPGTFTLSLNTLSVSATSTNVLCNGASNGVIAASVSGGGPYTYSWSPSGGTGATASGLAPGTYSVKITAANSCAIGITKTIVQPAALTSAASATNVSCNGAGNGSAAVTASGGTSAYAYSWSPSGGSGATATGLGAGNYTVLVTDAHNCTSTSTVVVTQPSAISLTVSSTQATCGSSNATASVAATGGAGSYTYAWAPSGGTAATATGLNTGNYTVTVTDGNGCSKTGNTSVSNSGSPTASISSASIACNGGSTGTATVSPTGGTAPYTYTWSPSGGNSATASGLAAGNYTITVADVNNCVVTKTVSLAQPPSVTASILGTNVSCNGLSNGSSTVTASGGTGPYTYNWSPAGGTSATATGLSSGNYTLTVTDASNCQKTATINISQPAPLAASLSATNAKCNGASTGSSTVTASGGTSAYTYSWSPAGGTGATATGLAAGNYTVLVTDAHNCTTTNTTTISQPSAITLTTSSLPAACGGSNGSATVTATGGTGSYTYAWTPSGGAAATATGLSAGNYSVTITDANGCSKTGNTSVSNAGGPTASISSASLACNGGGTGTATVSPTGGTMPYTYTWSPSGGNTATASGLTAGNYTVTVADANNCIVIKTVSLSQPPAISAGLSASNVSCNGLSTGSSTATVSGGTGPYTYNWSPAGGTSATATGLSAGNYTLTVTDASNCQKTATINISQPAPLAASLSVTNANCNGASTGSSTVTVSGGTSAYTYSWSPAGGTGATATGLAAGSYTVLVTDAHSCITTNTTTISQPSAITLTTSSGPAACGGSNGSATVTAAGGTGSYSYVWSPSGGTAATAPGLSAGSYTITVTDANSCSKTGNVIVNNAGGPSAAVSSASVACNGGSTGTATVSPTGGTAPYTYTWSPSGGNSAAASGLSAGNYAVTVADANNCITTSTVSIAQPGAINANVSVTNASCNGLSNGSSTLTVSGGTSPYTYSWTASASTGTTAPNLSAGSYTATVTDAHSCVTTNTFSISQPAAVSIATAVTNVTCNGGSNGSATLTVSGGTGPYTYSWSPSGGSGSMASGLTAGNYTIGVLDSHACPATAFASVNNGISPPAPGIPATNSYCQGQPVNPLTANGTGGTLTWYSDAALNNQLATGSSYTPAPTPSATTVYYVSETNGNGCKGPGTADTVKINPNPAAATPMNEAACQGLPVNPLTTTATGGTVTWYANAALTSTVSTGNTYTPSPSPTVTTVYYLVVTSASNCKSAVTTDTVKVYANPSLSGNVVIDTAKCGTSTGAVLGLVASGGTPAYTYQWTNISTGTAAGNQPNLSNVGPGTYSLVITDVHGCKVGSATGYAVPATAAVEAAFTPSTLEGETPVAVSFSNTSTGAVNYAWTFGDASASSAQQNPNYTYNSMGTYTVTLIASNAGCTDTATAVINVHENTVLIIPNVFSPNDDGTNDAFFITMKGIKSFQCYIYNRWGEQLFLLDGPNQVWDGKISNGNNAPDGTYFYLLEATAYSGKTYKKEGPLTLIR